MRARTGTGQERPHSTSHPGSVPPIFIAFYVPRDIALGLGGASRYELAAFKLTAWEYALAAEVPDWTAIAVVWDEGNWREIVAERQWL